MDGFQLAEAIRQRPVHSAMRILMLTSAGRSDKEALRGKLDISRILLKPVKHSTLLVAITDALGVTSAQAREAAASERPGDVPVRQVLLVEDNPVNQKVARDLLMRRGHNIQVVQNGKEAVEAVRWNRFDVVLMDIHMPVMDGLTAARRIRDAELATGVHVPIVAMTAGATTEDRERCFAAGMDDYVTKPFRADELFRAVELTLHTPTGRETAPVTVLAADAAEESASVEPGPGGPPLTEAGAGAGSAAQAREFENSLDWAGALKKLDGDEELLCELAEIFLDQSPALIAAIEAAITSGDAGELRRAAHTLKGSTHVIGGRALAAAALRLESMGREGRLNEAAAAFADLGESVARLKPALELAISERAAVTDSQ
jgi:CheY-like chemotaxis protein